MSSSSPPDIILIRVSRFQRALAMLAGLITPPIIFASALNLGLDLQSHVISGSLIGCGILSLVQISHISIPGATTTSAPVSLPSSGRHLQLFLPAFPSSTVYIKMANARVPPLPTGPLREVDARRLWAAPQNFSYLLVPRDGDGFSSSEKTYEVLSAYRHRNRNLAHWHLSYWRSTKAGIFTLCPTIFAKRPLPGGSPEFTSLGFLSFIAIVVVELFGSPFLKNASIIVGLLVGRRIVAGAVGYMDSSQIDSFPAITYVPLGAHLQDWRIPACDSSDALSLAMKAIGDITASTEVSHVKVDGEMFDNRIQGGVLADG
ncbi:hypothetical protein FS749_008057 [Ceratobasidium sp. UAMH 11750]|nr:hypothetical protein FS749_008057 [Ceratobasidium sp. UAMH 11750]